MAGEPVQHLSGTCYDLGFWIVDFGLGSASGAATSAAGSGIGAGSDGSGGSDRSGVAVAMVEEVSGSSGASVMDWFQALRSPISTVAWSQGGGSAASAGELAGSSGA